MYIDKSLICPKCKGKHFEMKREATYVYTYKIGSFNNVNLTDEEEFLPFLFDNREQTDSKEFLECLDCGTKYPYLFDKEKQKIDLTILRKAVRADHQKTPEFLG